MSCDCPRRETFGYWRRYRQLRPLSYRPRWLCALWAALWVEIELIYHERGCRL